MAEPNTVDTNNEPTLEDFNGSEPAQVQPASSEPAAATPAATPAADQKPAADAQPAAKTQEPAVPATNTDPYADVDKNLTIPQGVQVDKQMLDNLKSVAKQYNISVDGVKALLQLDINNNAAQAMAEDKLIADAQAKWAQENQAKYGDNLKNVETNCSRVLAELDKDGKFKELLANAGVEKHPATLGFLKAIGDITLEKPSVNPNATVSTEEEVDLENFN